MCHCKLILSVYANSRVKNILNSCRVSTAVYCRYFLSLYNIYPIVPFIHYQKHQFLKFLLNSFSSMSVLPPTPTPTPLYSKVYTRH